MEESDDEFSDLEDIGDYDELFLMVFLQLRTQLPHLMMTFSTPVWIRHRHCSC